MEPFKDHPALMDVWQDSETSLSKSILGNFQHWYPADMLGSVYSYTMWWWKYISLLCAWKMSFLKSMQSQLCTNVTVYFLYNTISKVIGKCFSLQRLLVLQLQNQLEHEYTKASFLQGCQVLNKSLYHRPLIVAIVCSCNASVSINGYIIPWLYIVYYCLTSEVWFY